MTESAPPTEIPRPRRGRVWLAFVVLLLVLAGMFLVGYLPRVRQQAALAAAAQALDGPVRVRVTTPKPAPATTTLRLPGSVQALRETTVYARSNGYVKRWHADLGDTVTEGQLLVELDAPEMAHQLAEAQANLARSRATLKQVEANLTLAGLQLQRMKALGNVTSQQEIDIRQAANDSEAANRESAIAQVAADEANVARLTQLKGFSRVLAPFAGTVVERNAEVGELVTSGSGSGANALFRIAQSDTVRIGIDVPQSAAGGITRGLAARILATGQPPVGAQVARTAKALDHTTRTMRIEVQAANPDGRLLPGMYVQVELGVPAPQGLLLVNANALIAGSAGPQVAVVGGDGAVELRSLVIDHDTGAEVAVTAGVTARDRVILNPPPDLAAGTRIEVLPPPEPAKPPTR